MTRLDERYPDLLGEPERPTSARIRLVGDLDRAYTVAPPPHLRAAIAAALRERATAADHHGGRAQPRRRRVRPLRWSRGVILLAAAVLLGASIYGSAALAGVLPPPPQLFLAPLFAAFTGGTTAHGDAAVPTIAPDAPGQAVNLVQSTCGYTMTVTRVYADANRVYVGFTITGPAGRTFDNISPDLPNQALTDAQGDTLGALDGFGTYPQGNQTGVMYQFDASSVTGHPDALALHLTVPKLIAWELVGNTDPPPVACETYSHVGGALIKGHRERPVTVAGPFSYDFTVPVSPSRDVAPHQTIDVGGTAVTLERIVATPFETTLYLRGVTVGQNPFIDLTANGRMASTGMSWTTSTGLTACAFEWTSWFYDHPGAWTVTITPRSDQRGWQPLAGGPWVFHVTVPATTTAMDTAGPATPTDVPTEGAATATTVSMEATATDVPTAVATGAPAGAATTVTGEPTVAATAVPTPVGIPTAGPAGTPEPSPSPVVPVTASPVGRPLPPVTATAP